MRPIVVLREEGEDFWPLSRTFLPKAFVSFFGESLVAKTLQRLAPLGPPTLWTTRGMGPLTESSLNQCQFPLNIVFYESGARALFRLADLCCQLRESLIENEVVGLFPADHWVENEEVLIQLSCEAETLIQNGTAKVVSLERPLSSLEEADTQISASEEEPDTQVSTSDFDSIFGTGSSTSSLGVFFFEVKGMISYLQSHAPELWGAMESIRLDRSKAKETYQRISSLNIPTEMSSLGNLKRLSGEMGWSDLASWGDVFNHTHLKTRSQDVAVSAQNNRSLSLRKKVIGFLGVENLYVVDTDDALLICDGKKGESIKELVRKVKELSPQVVDYQNWDMRPWGRYQTLQQSDSELVKKIWVSSGAKFSYQSHNFREEHWVIVEGQGEVILDGHVIPVKKGSYIHIPQKAKHRMVNIGKGELVFIEIQQGEKLLESDIIRYEDDFGRL